MLRASQALYNVSTSGPGQQPWIHEQATESGPLSGLSFMVLAHCWAQFRAVLSPWTWTAPPMLIIQCGVSSELLSGS
jgi:hypothetical protein